MRMILSKIHNFFIPQKRELTAKEHAAMIQRNRQNGYDEIGNDMNAYWRHTDNTRPAMTA